MRSIITPLACALLLASAPAMAQTNGLYRPTPQKVVPAGDAARAMSPATATPANGGLVVPPGSPAPVLTPETLSRSIGMSNFETCAYTLSEVQAKMPNAQVRRTNNTMEVTTRHPNLVKVSSCASDGKFTTTVYTNGRAPQGTPPGSGGGSRPNPGNPGTPVVRQQQR